MYEIHNKHESLLENAVISTYPLITVVSSQAKYLLE